MNCGKRIIFKRTLLNFFDTKRRTICETCESRFPLRLSWFLEPLEHYEAIFVRMVEGQGSFCMDAYTEEVAKVFQFFYMKYPNYFLVYLDNLYLNDIELYMLSFLADTEKKNLLVLCGTLRK